MRRTIFLGFLALFASCGAAMATCPASRLINSTTADADAVMALFDCAAPLNNPAFTGNIFAASSDPYQTLLSLQNNASGGRTWYVMSTGPSQSGAGRFSIWDASAGERLSINTSGAVGIGTSSPNFNLDVVGTIHGSGDGMSYAATNYYGGGLDISATNGSQFLVRIDNGGLTGTAGSFDIYNNTAGHGGSVLVINPTSNYVGIGTASPAEKLDVAGTIKQSNCLNAQLSASSTGAIQCYSDARLKDIRGDYSVGLAAIELLAPKRFSFKSIDGRASETYVHAGFIAQNVKAVIPEAVAVQKSGYYSVDTTAILAASVNAIKQQQKQIEGLRAANAAQSASIGELRTQLAVLQRRVNIRTASR